MPITVEKGGKKGEKEDRGGKGKLTKFGTCEKKRMELRENWRGDQKTGEGRGGLFYRERGGGGGSGASKGSKASGGKGADVRWGSVGK